MASEVTHCGEAGAGQAVKILNNMVLFQTVVGLAEALCIARANGVDGKILFETLTKGSADSFGLRNHGMKAMLPGVFPQRAFSTNYALKDLVYAIRWPRSTACPRSAPTSRASDGGGPGSSASSTSTGRLLIKAIEDATKKYISPRGIRSPGTRVCQECARLCRRRGIAKGEGASWRESLWVDSSTRPIHSRRSRRPGRSSCAPTPGHRCCAARR
jgi:hypothetical protein